MSEYNITKIVDHPRYGLVLKLVLRGEKKESIYKRMIEHDVDEREFNLLIDTAQKERVSILKSDSCSQIFAGIIILGIVFIAIMLFWWQKIPGVILYGCVLGVVYSVWLVIDGIKKSCMLTKL